MSLRNTSEDLGVRQLTARSVLLSTLLGLDPPMLPAARLVATAGLFGIGEGAARVALSRMAAAGEVVVDEGRYRLTGTLLLERQRRQSSGWHPHTKRWRGDWHLAVVPAGRRTAAERAELRAALTGARFAEWREGVWTRPANLDAPDLASCQWLHARPETEPAALAAQLWDLADWATVADALLGRLAASRGPLDADDTGALAPGFMLSAAVLRHLAADPLLPPELLPEEWPGTALRRDYDAWDASYRRLLARWHRDHRTRT